MLDERLADIAHEYERQLAVAHLFVLRHQPQQCFNVGLAARDFGDARRQAHGAEVALDARGAWGQ